MPRKSLEKKAYSDAEIAEKLRESISYVLLTTEQDVLSSLGIRQLREEVKNCCEIEAGSNAFNPAYEATAIFLRDYYGYQGRIITEAHNVVSLNDAKKMGVEKESERQNRREFFRKAEFMMNKL